VLAQPAAQFCRRGVEDFAQGKARAAAAATELQSRKMQVPARADHSTTDYVQLTDDLLDVSDGYWSEPNTCWDDSANPNPVARQAQCVATFGATLDPNNPTTSRDFPILEAYDDRLVIGNYGYRDASKITAGREVWPSAKGDGRADANKPFMRMLQCCFHKQVHFNVRAGNEWVAIGSVSGYLHHVQPQVTSDPATTGRCVQSCDPRLALMNARALGVPRPTDPATGSYFLPAPPIARDSALALRNPMFSVVVWNGEKLDASPTNVTPDRDMVWKLSTRGQFTPQTISIAAKTSSVAPQSMRFIESLGQLALVDGAAEGLVLIDLNTVSFAHDPYF
jgi:hypothetical protein